MAVEVRKIRIIEAAIPCEASQGHIMEISPTGAVYRGVPGDLLYPRLHKNAACGCSFSMLRWALCIAHLFVLIGN
ncbi:MAG: hypothetical protein ACK56F_29685 [bacterium]